VPLALISYTSEIYILSGHYFTKIYNSDRLIPELSAKVESQQKQIEELKKAIKELKK